MLPVFICIVGRTTTILNIILMIRSIFFRYFKTYIFHILLFSFFLPNTFAQDENPIDSLTASELIRGERLFYGLVYTKLKSVNCASCHYTTETDTINWNPSAYDISLKYQSKTVANLKSVLLKPRGNKMAQVHSGFDLSDADIVMLKSYMDGFVKSGMKEAKPIFTSLILFVFAIILIILAILDLIFFKKLKLKWIHLIVILAAAGYITKITVKESIAIGRQQYYSPTQPIKFSHQIHAGQNHIDCKYCHNSVEFSKTAGIPGTNVCMNCHLIVRSGTRSGSFEIAKVIDSYNEGIPIEWIRVHNLPDHAFFSHAQHISVGQLDCAECHGKVEGMHQVIQVSDLSMGWCIDCHRTKEVNFYGNEFYQQYEKIRQETGGKSPDGVTVERIGGIECMKCHY